MKSLSASPDNMEDESMVSIDGISAVSKTSIASAVSLFAETAENSEKKPNEEEK